MRWLEPTTDPELAWTIAKQCAVNPLLAGLLVQRGIRSVDEADYFLNPRLNALRDPFEVAHMAEFVERVHLAVQRNESVLVFGDYDVDGVTSTALLVLFLREFGLSPKFIVPRRLTEGYGLSSDSLDRALEHSIPHLLIAVDCGTSSAAEVAHLRSRGIDVAILDHHAPKESLPQDCVLVNPHVFDPPGVPWMNLSAVGLVFKFCHAFLKRLREEGDSKAQQMDLREHLDLVAMGTVADLVPMEGENRILVTAGLQRLRNCSRPGLCALLEVAGLRLGQPLATFDIGFRLGPRINASGRLEDATLPIELLLSPDRERGLAIARELDALNAERKQIETDIASEAEQLIEGLFADDPGLVLFQPHWHTGVVGITASRIARKHHRPTIVLGTDADGQLKGSGRSVDGVDLVQVLQGCVDTLSHWGGHPMAVGMTVMPDQLAAFRQAFCDSLLLLYPAGLPDKVLQIDAVAKAGDLTEDLLDQLDRMAPFGQTNPEPVFWIRNTALRSVSRLGSNGHWRFALAGSQGPIEGVAWGCGDNPPPPNEPIQLAVKFGWNEWKGMRSPRLTLVDWRN